MLYESDLTGRTTGCEEIMNALDECHARGFLYKATGGCNDIKREVNRCLSGERTKKSRNNRETALERRARIEAVWAKFDEGDFSALEQFTKSK
jgi:COX assembly protein 2